MLSVLDSDMIDAPVGLPLPTPETSNIPLFDTLTPLDVEILPGPTSAGSRR